MIAKATRYWQDSHTVILLAGGGGLVIAAIVTLTSAALSPKWILFTLAGFLLLLPSYFIKQKTLYWLGLYLLLFLELGGRGLSLTRDLVDPFHIINTLGVPPGSLTLSFLPSDVILFSLVFALILRAMRGRQSLYFPTAAYLVVAYFAWTIMSSILRAPYLYLSIVELVQQSKYFLIYFYVLNAADSKKTATGLVSLLMLCLFIEGVETLISSRSTYYYTGSFLLAPVIPDSRSDLPQVMTEVFEGADAETRRASGTFGPMATALYLHSLMPLAFVLWLKHSLSARKWLYLFLYALGTIALYLTYSRAGMVGFIASVLALLWLAYLRKFLSRKLLLVLAVMCSIALLILAPKLYDFLWSRPGTFSARFELINKGKELFLANPVLGVGLNNSTAAKMNLKDTVSGEWYHPIHNHYVVLATETGLVGFLLYIAFFVRMGAEAFRCSKSADRDIAALGVAFFTSYIAISVHVMADPLYGPAAFMLWFYTGLIVALRRLDDRKSSDSPGLSSQGNP